MLTIRGILSFCFASLGAALKASSVQNVMSLILFLSVHLSGLSCSTQEDVLLQCIDDINTVLML